MARIPRGVTLVHVPREQNSAADALSLAALPAGVTRRVYPRAPKRTRAQ
jgi:hypothetical protein